MIKTIKVKKQLRLDELIKYVWDNAIYPSHFESHAGFKIHFDSRAGIKVDNDYAHGDATVFTVEVEEEITEDTVFETLVTVGIHGTVLQHKNISLSELSGRQLIDEGRQVFALINGKLELIYERNEESINA